MAALSAVQGVTFSASIACLDMSDPGGVVTRLLQERVERLHVDMADETFGTTPALPYALLDQLEDSALPVEIHMMLSDTLKELPLVLKHDVHTVCVHDGGQASAAFELMRATRPGVRVGLVLDADAHPNANQLMTLRPDVVMAMAVRPGGNGRPFRPRVLNVLKELAEVRKELDLTFEIAADGSVGPKTIRQLSTAGAHHFVLGSTIFPDRVVATDFVPALRFLASVNEPVSTPQYV